MSRKVLAFMEQFTMPFMSLKNNSSIQLKQNEFIPSNKSIILHHSPVLLVYATSNFPFHWYNSNTEGNKYISVSFRIYTKHS